MKPSPLTVSIIIPTYNEEEMIGGLLESLKELAADELIVADGGSTDRTVEIAERFARVLRAPRGRGAQMNAGAHASSGDLLLFLHADARLGPGALEVAREAMSNPAVLGGNFDIRYEGGDWVASIFTWANRVRRRLGIFYGDSGIFCRRTVFEALGGYQPWPILEDYDMARRLWRAGSLVLLEEPIWISDRRWRKSGVFPTIWSWVWVQGLYAAGVSPHKLARFYRHVR